MKKSKTENINGLPISFLDALGLSLAAILLLMFTNLSALESRQPPREKHHLFVKACFTGNPNPLWNLTWKLQNRKIIFPEPLSDTRTKRKMMFRTSNPSTYILHWESPWEVLKTPLLLKEDEFQVAFNVIDDVTPGTLYEHPKSQTCYGLEITFPRKAEPSVKLEITRASLPLSWYSSSHIPRVAAWFRTDTPEVLPLQHSSCWRRIVILKRKAFWGEELQTFYALPQKISVYAYSTAVQKHPKPKSFQEKQQKIHGCTPRKIIFQTRMDYETSQLLIERK